MSETLFVGILGAVTTLVAAYIVHFLSLKRDKIGKNEINKLTEDNSSLKNEIQELKNASPKNFQIVKDVDDVLHKRILPILREQINLHDQIVVHNLGLDLQSVIPWIENQIINNREFDNIKLEINSLIIDPDSEYTKNLLGDGSNIRAENIKTSIQIANNFNTTYPDLIRFSLKMKKYKLPPIFHGFLLNDEHLFIGFTELKEGKIIGGIKPYIHLWNDGKTRSDFNSHYFNFFKNWFDYYWNISTEVANVKK
ncbi:MAG: hypothetical protein JSS63_06095 [Bacteroidetes bacterium]|nr:hypothetical protein [Bacteroidota bacterium]